MKCKNCLHLNSEGAKNCIKCSFPLMETMVGIQHSEVYLQTKNGLAFKINKSKTTIGRSGDIYFSKDPYMSKIHSTIKSYDGEYFIMDNKSSNGTRVNGKKINNSVKLSNGDQITCGQTEFKFKND